MSDCVNYECTHTQHAIFYISKKISKLTSDRSVWIRRYCYETFTGHKQHKKQVTLNMLPKLLPSLERRMRTHWYPKLINISLTSVFSSTDFELNIHVVTNVYKY